MSLGTKKCSYCKCAYSGGAREHVFPEDWGSNIFMVNVCENCNRKFSDYERTLMRDSPVAFMRSVEGIEGYRRSDIPLGAFWLRFFFNSMKVKKLSMKLVSGTHLKILFGHRF